MKSLALRIYRWFATAFPHEFQVVYGADLIHTGEDAIDDIWNEHGLMGLLRLVLDIAVRVPIEYLSEMRHDLAYAVRTLGKARGFAAVGILSLGLGIGATATYATQFFTAILRDLPGARDPGRLALIQPISYPYFEHYREQHDLIAGAAVFKTAVPFNVSLSGGASPKTERIFGQLVSPEYFNVIGITPARGRLFDPTIDRPGAAAVVFITDRFWRSRLNSDPDAVGRTLRVNGQTATIIGIGPQGFQGVVPVTATEVFVPTTSQTSMVPELAGDVIHKNVKEFTLLLRLAQGVSLVSAEAGMDAVTRRLDAETLDPARNIKGRHVQLIPGGKVLPIPREMMPVIVAFAALLSGLLIGIACMNLANMQLARATARRREVAIRLSVGASRFRLVRQLVTESLLLALTGGACGLAFAYWATSALNKQQISSSVPLQFEMHPDWHVLLTTFIVSLLAGVGFGLSPALAATRSDVASALKEGAAAPIRGFRRFGMRNIVMVCQVAGSLTLLLIASFMIIGFANNNRVEISFDGRSMFLFSVDPVRDGYPSDQVVRVFDNLQERLKAVSGVRNVVLSEAAPFSPEIGIAVISAPGEPGKPETVVSGVAKQVIGADFFSSIDVHMTAGREFDVRDQLLDPGRTPEKNFTLPVVINQTAARAFFGGRDPLGRRLLETGKSYEVVGVVKDISAPLSQSGGVEEELMSPPALYLPLNRTELASPPRSGITVMVRTGGPSAGKLSNAAVMQGIRREISAIHPDVAMFNLRTLSEDVDQVTSYLRIASLIYGGMGTFGLILSAIGLAGVTAYSVARRRKEIGIRIALGASKGQVLRLVMREGGILVAIGSVVGFFAAVGVSRALSALTTLLGKGFASTTHDPRLLLGAPLLLATLAMLACYLPARKSAKIDPMNALREE